MREENGRAGEKANEMQEGREGTVVGGRRT